MKKEGQRNGKLIPLPWYFNIGCGSAAGCTAEVKNLFNSN
jgi:hypothetical protein